MEGIVYRFLWSLMNVVLRVHVRKIYVTGRDKMPASGPAIFACNHTNAFFDAVLTATMMPVRYRLHFMTRADIFKGRWIPVLRAMSLIPVYRMRDGRDQLSRNTESFAETQRVLDRGESILIFSEGTCVVEKRVQKLLKGTARMAFQAAEAGIENLMVTPVGINYSSQTAFRMEVYLNYGEGIPIRDWMDQYRENPAKTINAFNERLRAEMINLSNHIEDPANDDAFEFLRAFPFKGEQSASFFSWKSTSPLAFQKEKVVEKMAAEPHYKLQVAKLHKEMQQNNQEFSFTPEYAQNESTHLAARHFVMAILIYWLAKPFTAIPKLLIDKIVAEKIKQKMFISSIRMTGGMLIWFGWWLLILILSSFLVSNWIVLIIAILSLILSMLHWKAGDILKEWRSKNRWIHTLKQYPKLANELMDLGDQLEKNSRA